MITAIIPTTNRPHFLRTALKSVHRQTALARITEIIVSENAGSRASEQVCGEFPNLPIRYIFREPTLTGLEHAVLLFGEAKNEHIAILHDDDWWSPHHIENGARQIAAHADLGAYYSAYFMVGSERAHLQCHATQEFWAGAGFPSFETEWTMTLADTAVACLVDVPCSFSSLIASRRHLQTAWEEVVKSGNCYDNDRTAILELAKLGNIIVNPAPEIFVRFHPGQDQKRSSPEQVKEFKKASLQYLLNLCRKHQINLGEEFDLRMASAPDNEIAAVCGAILRNYDCVVLERLVDSSVLLKYSQSTQRPMAPRPKGELVQKLAKQLCRPAVASFSPEARIDMPMNTRTETPPPRPAPPTAAESVRPAINGEAKARPAQNGNSTAKKASPHFYSLATMQELIVEVLHTAKAATIVEIGSEHGSFTEILCARARENGGRLISIDPYPQAVALEFAKAHEGDSFQFIRKTSHEALPGLQADVYIIDGDHNYYTVRRELELIEAARNGAPWLAILHDVSWPWGRRDFYYNPAAIPAPSLRPHSHEGRIAPGNRGLVEGGLFGCEGPIEALALEEGGPGNGVRTAVEDFLSGKAGLKFAVIPVVYGLGVVYTMNAPWAGALAKVLAPYDSNPLLARLEKNRLEMSLKAAELERQLSARPPMPERPVRLPKSPLGLRLLATAFFVEQQWADAGLLFQTVVRHFPNDLEVWRAHLECARQQKHQTHVRMIFNDALRIHPEWAESLTAKLAPV
jgi:predicted O-methyltransferase YrrM